MAIITLQDLKDFIGLDDTDEDVRLTTIVNAVNVMIVKYIGRNLEETEYTGEMYDGTGTDCLILRQFPIVAIDQILLRGSVVPEWEGWSTDTGGAYTSTETMGWYIKDAENGTVYNRYCWPNGRGIISVDYTAGYDTIPDDIFFGTLEFAAAIRNLSQRPGITSEYLGSYNITLMNSMSASNFDLSIADPVFRMILDQERAKTARELVF